MKQPSRVAEHIPVFVIGTRAQLIKVAPVMRAVQDRAATARLLLTGQHQETMQDLLDEFGVELPQEALFVGRERATLGSLFGWLPRAYIALVRSLKRLQNEYGSISVVVHGDTLSTLIGAVAGARVGCAVMHLESGLSSGRLLDPFPEELTRRIVFRYADVAFCPSPEAAAHMRSRFDCTVIDTGGNTIVDAVRLAGAVPADSGAVEPYMVASLHRFQNIFDAARLRELVDLIEAISQRYRVHFVLHPATRKRLSAEGLLARLETCERVHLSPRLGYRDFLTLAARASCVLTDGGSNQEELSVLGVPTIVMRERTERSDGLGQNAVMEGDITDGVREFLLKGAQENLRRKASVLPEGGPSAVVANVLCGADGPGQQDVAAAR